MDENKILKDLLKCEKCNGYKGIVKNDGDNERVLVSCLCDGILCTECRKNNSPKPLTNYYDDETGTIWHVPHLIQHAVCKECQNKLKAVLTKLNEEYPLVPHTHRGRLFSTVQRMKAEKERNIPIYLRSSFAISVMTGKHANEMTEQEWESFYGGLCEQLKNDFPDMYSRLFTVMFEDKIKEKLEEIDEGINNLKDRTDFNILMYQNRLWEVESTLNKYKDHGDVRSLNHALQIFKETAGLHPEGAPAYDNSIWDSSVQVRGEIRTLEELFSELEDLIHEDHSL